MTPQLQQAIRMLQLSTLELQMEVQQALDSNLMLEEEDEFDLEAEQETDYEQEEGGDEADGGSDPLEALEAAETAQTDEQTQAETLPDELPVDSNWEDTFDYSTPAGPAPDDDRPFEQGDDSSESLREHLIWQMEMGQFSPDDRLIAEAIIDAVGDDGLLTQSLEEIREALAEELPELEEDEIEAVLHAVQQFDPPGVAARDLRESLLLQLRQLDEKPQWGDEAERLLAEHFELLANRDYTQLKRKMKLNEDQLIEVVKLIQSLNPRPGGHISNSRPEYIVPDVRVFKHEGQWRVELNAEAIPRLRVNDTYASLIKQVRDPQESTTMKNHLQEARWFIKSLLSRNETLLRVTTSIVEHQRGFLEQGEVAMKAMVLHDIADELGMHESTISRVTTRKYMHTPRGVFELKYFFSSHVGTADGGEASSTAIRALIKELIAEEPPKKPLSDNKITQMLDEKGIKVARRTVAKYREAMNIPPSNERKRLA